MDRKSAAHGFSVLKGRGGKSHGLFSLKGVFMIIVMKSQATEKQIEDVISWIESVGYKAHPSSGVARTIIGAVGDNRDKAVLKYAESLPGVEKTMPILKPYKLASRESHEGDTVINVGTIAIGGPEFVVMAGPCAIESEEQLLESAYIVYRARRYDLKGKQILKTLEKFYIVDMGIRNQLTGLRNTDYGHTLENVVFFELLRRGYVVNIGKNDSLEIDFVATKPKEKLYIQVSASILDDSTRNRELRPLSAIHDSYPKYILTMDRSIITDIEGIKVVNIIDFLLSE